MKRVFLVLGLIVVVTVFILGLAHFSAGFKLRKVVCQNYHEAHFDNRFERGSYLELQKILDQPFYYLGKGCQIYAFESQDKKYVIKFVKQHRYLQPFKWQFLPFFKISVKEAAYQRGRIASSFKSYRLAFDQLKVENGLIYAHFDRTFEMPKIKIYDPFKRSQVVDLNDVFFLVQKKGVNFKTLFSNLNKKRAVKEAKELIDSVVTSLNARLKKHIFDRDLPGFVRNLGFIEQKAINIDVGNFKKEENASSDDLDLEYDKCISKLKKWSDKDFPELSQYIDERYSTR